ncbi:MAG TPA: OprO/OprP family phosphate-selective porin [Candidatus Acidoferrales bacterium]|nr:OprO/OprP family phosphate-selective porin [Candidatus Acidoferrales bacterium]
MRRPAIATAMVGAVALGPVHAAEAPPADLEALQQRLDQLEQMVGQLRTQLDTERQARQAVESAAVIRPVSDGKSLKFQSPGGDFSFQAGGRLDIDAAAYDEDKQDLGDGTDFRRARMYMRGTLARDFDYMFEYEFADSATRNKGITDAYMRYKGFAPALITVGNFKMPFGMEQLTSDNTTIFLERGVNDILTPGRGIGAELRSAGANWSLAGGVFGEKPDGDVDKEGDEGWNVAARGTYAPILTDNAVLHLGAGARRHDSNDSTNALRFRSKPESNVTGVFLVDSGVLSNTDHFTSANAELASLWGPVSFQAEYMRTVLDRGDTAEDVNFSGWHAQAAWLMTGERRPYKASEGVFDRVIPKASVGLGGIGAWELAARVSEVNLNDGNIVGGEERNLTLALNGYLTSNIRLMLNYIRVLELDRPGNAADQDEPSIIGARLHVDF